MNYKKFYIHKTAESPLCRMCRVENETISHIVSESKMLTKQEYKTRHGNVYNYIPAKKHGFEGAPQ